LGGLPRLARIARLHGSRAELGFGYVMNQMALGAIGDQRAYRFVEAVYASLE
jgi:hypothetical protein